jgi:hypothetical protein
MPQGQEYWRRSRASKGGEAARKTNRSYFLRKVVGHDREGRELLECGHTIWPRQDMAGEYPAARRRCLRCPKPEVA